MLAARDASGLPALGTVSGQLALRARCWRTLPTTDDGNSRPTLSRILALYGLQKASAAASLIMRGRGDNDQMCAHCYRAMMLPTRVPLRDGQDREQMEVHLMSGQREQADEMYGRACRQYLRSAAAIRHGHRDEAIKRLATRAKRLMDVDDARAAKVMDDLLRLLGDD